MTRVLPGRRVRSGREASSKGGWGMGTLVETAGRGKKSPYDIRSTVWAEDVRLLHARETIEAPGGHRPRFHFEPRSSFRQITEVGPIASRSKPYRRPKATEVTAARQHIDRPEPNRSTLKKSREDVILDQIGPSGNNAQDWLVSARSTVTMHESTSSSFGRTCGADVPRSGIDKFRQGEVLE